MDLAQLRHLARPPEASWPLEPGAGKPELRSRLWEHARSQAGKPLSGGRVVTA